MYLQDLPYLYSPVYYLAGYAVKPRYPSSSSIYYCDSVPLLSLRKACRSLQGTASRKRQQLIEAAKCNEKKIESKVGYMTWTKPCKLPTLEPERKLVMQEPMSLSADDSDFQVAV